MKTVKEWLKTKNNKQFEVHTMVGNVIAIVNRLSDNDFFARFTRVYVNNNTDVLYKIAVFSEDLIHIGVIPSSEHPHEATVITTQINNVRRPTIEEYANIHLNQNEIFSYDPHK